MLTCFTSCRHALLAADILYWHALLAADVLYMLNKVFSDNKIDTVIHCAGLKAVGESVRERVSYYDVC